MKSNVDKSWLKAAVIGSIWASFEIIFGSFFHSLRLPFAGTFLTFFSIILLIVFSYKWQEKNIFFKAGIIAALMRSMMPTSVILGPLIGILSEAVLFQLAINFFGTNFFAFSIAGILAMFSAIIHKVVSIILIYGWDIVKILKNIYYVFLKMTHLDLPFNRLFIIVSLVYVLFGFLSAFVGIKVGKKISLKSNEIILQKPKWQVKQSIFDLPDFHYKSKFIFIHVSMLIISLFILEFYPLQYVFIPVLIYIGLIYKRYGTSLRRLAKWLFWIQLLIILIIAVLMWENHLSGLIIGLKMILRAVLVVSVFTAISVELKNPLVKSLLYKKGYSQLYSTLGLATASVPFILKNISVEKKDFINPFKILIKIISLSDSLLIEFTNYLKQTNKIYIISGDVRSGKTTFLKKFLKILKKENPNIKIGGIIAYGIDKKGERFGFEIENIMTKERKFLCSQLPVKNAIKTGRFYFSKEGLNFGRKALLDNLKDLEVLVIDEVGYLELKGKGWFEVIEEAMKRENLTMIWVVRKRILEEVIKQWSHINFEVININN